MNIIMNKKKVLIVEDDTFVAFMVQDYLASENFDSRHIHNDFQHITKKVVEYDPDIILLDVNLDENTNGFNLARLIRASGDTTPIIFTTARTEYEDVERGYKIGNVDYVKKPYTARELVLHIKELIFRNEGVRPNEQKSYSFGNAIFYPDERRLVLGNQADTILRKNENEVLDLLFAHKEQLVSKDAVAKAIWEDERIDAKEKESSINNLIYSLRTKLSKGSGLEILTVNRAGYKLTRTKSAS
ncbi:transcriptional regulator [Bacteroidia bacterium]|nr:transcriptional regulator [Bacteroidia bacterium]